MNGNVFVCRDCKWQANIARCGWSVCYKRGQLHITLHPEHIVELAVQFPVRQVWDEYTNLVEN